MRAIGVLAVGLALMVPLGCSRKSDEESLRDGLSRMPSDTVVPAPRDSGPPSAPAPEGPQALPDTAGLPSAPPGALGPPSGLPLQPPESAPDTIPPGLKPTPRDTRPWVPVPETIPPAAWTTEPSEARGEGQPVLLTAIRAARNAGFDRIVFEFEGPQLPGYRVEYLTGPARHCGSGNRAPIAGKALLAVRLSPAQMHREDGQPTLQPFMRTDLPTVPELRRTCDFEGQVEWVLGLDAQHPYRVIALHDPARLVVDLER